MIEHAARRTNVGDGLGAAIASCCGRAMILAATVRTTLPFVERLLPGRDTNGELFSAENRQTHPLGQAVATDARQSATLSSRWP